ncbi:hypothetical protein [Kinneretia aquatilis]|uniref:hypothetical protein n=1 Tax=Kinneretia aquatilis TaxID=2070761 RepID=UPI001056FCCF|nr:hypothetical protein [Paucibacter aquatile]
MKAPYEELEEILSTFDGDLESTGQGWCDVGAQWAESTIGSFREEDWVSLFNRKEQLTEGQMRLLVHALSAATEEKALPFLTWLCSVAKGWGWIEAMESLSYTYVSKPELLNVIEPEVTRSIRGNFNTEIVWFINQNRSDSQSIEDYLYKYAHLVDQNIMTYYEEILKNT